MSDNLGHDFDDSTRRHADLAVDGPGYEGGGDASYDSAPAYSSSLVGDSRLGSRGNAPVLAAVMQRMQQTHGNRALQRYLQRCACAGGAQEENVQRASAEGGTATAEENIGEQIQSKSGGGSSLEPHVQSKLEDGLGADMSGVRVHNDGDADRMTRSVDAVAFTTGNDIFFRSGTYNPSSSEGMHLLAHEATHTVQQAQGPVSGTPSAGGVSISDPSDSYEQAAEASASQVVSRMQASTAPSSATGSSGTGGTSVQREADEEEEGPAAQAMRTSTYASIQRQADEEEEEGPAAQAMRMSTYASVQREAEEEEEGPAAQAMRTSTYASVQREADEEEEGPAAQAMNTTTYASVQREADEEEEEGPAAQAMSTGTYASVQREAEGAEEEEEGPAAQAMRTSTYASVQREAEEEEEGPAAQAMSTGTYASVQRHAGHEEEVSA